MHEESKRSEGANTASEAQNGTRTPKMAGFVWSILVGPLMVTRSRSKSLCSRWLVNCGSKTTYGRLGSRMVVRVSYALVSRGNRSTHCDTSGQPGDARTLLGRAYTEPVDKRLR
jgi:hypothetical protein